MSVIDPPNFNFTSKQKKIINSILTVDHGLLLWWKMGTGKTILGLGIINEWIKHDPNQKIILICPETITSTWNKDLKTLKDSNISKEIKISDANINFDTNKINNVVQIKTGENDKDYSIKEILSKDYENSIVIIDEAHNIIPLIKKDIDVFEKLKKSKRIYMLTGTPLYDNISDLVYLVNLASISDGNYTQILDFNRNQFRNRYYDTNKKRSIIFGYLVPLFFFFYALNDIRSLFTGLFLVYAILDYVKYLDIVKQARSSLGMKKSKKKINRPKILGYLEKIGKYKKQILVVTYFMLFLTITAFIVKRLYKYSIDDFKYLNTTRLANDIKKYCRYNDSTNGFPKSSRKSMTIPYSEYQLQMWIESTQGYFSRYSLEVITQDIKNVDVITREITKDEYIKNGVAFGNLIHNNECPKFKSILGEIGNKKAVIFSQFKEHGTELMKKYLETNYKQIKFIVLTKEFVNDMGGILNFNDNIKDCQIVIIGNEFTEGLNIRNADQIHLMEPIPIVSKKEQVIARVIRKDSSDDPNRTVYVYQWSCEMKTIMEKIQKFTVSVKKWYEHNTEVAYIADYDKFDQEMTPDSYVLKKESIEGNYEKDIVKYF